MASPGATIDDRGATARVPILMPNLNRDSDSAWTAAWCRDCCNPARRRTQARKIRIARQLTRTVTRTRTIQVVVQAGTTVTVTRRRAVCAMSDGAAGRGRGRGRAAASVGRGFAGERYLNRGRPGPGPRRPGRRAGHDGPVSPAAALSELVTRDSPRADGDSVAGLDVRALTAAALTGRAQPAAASVRLARAVRRRGGRGCRHGQPPERPQ